MPFDERSVSYYLGSFKTQNEAYKYKNDSLYILDTSGTAVEFSKAADARHIEALSKAVVKHFVIHMKDVTLPEL